MTLTALGVGVAAWAWENYGKSVVDETTESLKSRWDRFRWREAAESYRSKIRTLFGLVQIMGMSEPVFLDDIFTDVYLLDKPTAFRRFDIQTRKDHFKDPIEPPKGKRINGLRLVVEKKNLYILGKPGAGKTTFLKYIAVKAAENTLDKVPIFIGLKQWADSSLNLNAFIVSRFDICGFPDANTFVEVLLKSGRALVLFDGLDEVNQENGQRDKQIEAINEFIEKYHSTQCLITCRIAADDYSFQPFTYVEIADFTEQQVKTFVGNWFREEGEKDERIAKRFWTELQRDSNKGIRDLARTPLLLTLMCLAFNETLNFPPRRVVLYKEALDALLKRWDSSRKIRRDETYKNLDLAHKENMLSHIAAETFKDNQHLIPQQNLEKLIRDYIRNVPPHDPNQASNPEAILKAIEAQHGIFVERARGVYSFSHLTFHEYFAAKHFVDYGLAGSLERLAREHFGDSRWREVILMTTSLLPDASDFIKQLRMRVDYFLRDDPQLISLLTWAKSKSDHTQADSWLVRQNYLFIECYYSSRFKFAIAQSLSRGIGRDNNTPGLELDRALARAALSPPSNNKVFPRLINLALVAGEPELANELEKYASGMKLDEVGVTANEIIQYTDKIQALIRKYRDCSRDWDLSTARTTILLQYLRASALLHDCLDLAFMPPDKKTLVENSLYLPPD